MDQRSTAPIEKMSLPMDEQDFLDRLVEEARRTMEPPRDATPTMEELERQLQLTERMMRLRSQFLPMDSTVPELLRQIRDSDAP